MTPADLPPNERLRLAVLSQCGVLDSEPEEDFDTLSRLASELLDAPIALISLIDTDRQWFKSRVGLEAPQSSRDIAFCTHSILQDDLFVVLDASRDERFHDNPFVTEPPHIRFYAGAPLRSPEGTAYGTLCVIDDKPRETLPEREANILRGLARQATAQLELRRKNRRLEDEMRTRRETELQLEAARNRAEAANLAKSTFLANMSHEIRTPLGSIIGFSEQLTSQSTAPEDQRREWLEIIHSAADHLLSLVNDVLDVSKIEANRITFERIATSPRRAIEQAADLLRSKARERGLTIETRFEEPMPEAVWTDPTRLRQVVVNLLGNAVKFTEHGGVTLEASYDAQATGPQLRIAVRDTGPGMDAETLERLFTPFTQADAQTTRRHGGTGLGLHISREICRQLGGELTAHSTPGEGSTFLCTLRADTAEAKDLREESGAWEDKTLCTGESARCRVLLADDCEANRKLFGLILRRAGFAVGYAVNGEEAVEACKRAASTGGYHLVLMDVQMPTVDGIEATRRLRAMGFDRPIVALTADATVETRTRSREAGCDDYLCKPLQAAELLSCVRRTLGSRAGRNNAA